ncbi:putative E3 ubiquitin-protein ligase HTD2, partial [Blyttiomyces sp. JEL0837]
MFVCGSRNEESVPLAKDVNVVNAVLCLDMLNNVNDRKKFIAFEEFYNEAIQEALVLKEEYPKWKSNQGLSFLDFPFLLDSSAKGDILKIESMISMRRELQDAFFRAMFIGVNSPYLNLEVRRDHIVRDAISQLATKTPNDLRKQLRVSFAGEEGIDEGGIQKEFFQLIVNDIFDPRHGMFEINSESRLCWFTKDQFDDPSVLEEYALIGKLLGLAIYNSVTLDIPFPLALFKKILNVPTNLEDLIELDPILGKGFTD